MSASINATIHRYIHKTAKLLIFLICANSFSFRRMDGIRMFGVMMPFHAHNYFQKIRIGAFSRWPGRGTHCLPTVGMCVILYQVLGCSRAHPLAFSFITVITVIIFLPFICLFFLCMFVFHGWIHTILNTLCRNAAKWENTSRMRVHSRGRRRQQQQKSREPSDSTPNSASWTNESTERTAMMMGKKQQRNYRLKASNLTLHSGKLIHAQTKKKQMTLLIQGTFDYFSLVYPSALFACLFFSSLSLSLVLFISVPCHIRYEFSNAPQHTQNSQSIEAQRFLIFIHTKHFSHKTFPRACD